MANQTSQVHPLGVVGVRGSILIAKDKIYLLQVCKVCDTNILWRGDALAQKVILEPLSLLIEWMVSNALICSN